MEHGYSECSDAIPVEHDEGSAILATMVGKPSECVAHWCFLGVSENATGFYWSVCCPVGVLLAERALQPKMYGEKPPDVIP
jgi:hypothetical protein